MLRYPLAVPVALAAALVSGTCHSGPRLVRGPACLVYPDFWGTPFGIHRGTQRLLDLLLDGAVRFNDPQGAACAPMDPGTPGPPVPTFFGVNAGSGQIVYNPDLRSLAVYGGLGSGPGRFLRPHGIACLPDGTVAVADSGNDRVVFLRYLRGRLTWDHALGSPGRGAGQFLDPEGVALDSQGRLFVADTGNDRVQVFDRAGVFLGSFGADPGAANALDGPQALAVEDPLETGAHRPEAALFVADQGSARLQKFSLNGDFLSEVSGADLGRPGMRFGALALDYFGNVWATDPALDEIHKFDAHLQWIDDWGRPGDGDGRLDQPRGIAILRAYGQVVVLERACAQYLWIGADLEGLRVTHARDLARGGWARFDYRVSEGAWVWAWIEDTAGRRVATLLKRGYQSQGDQTLYWNGLADGGRPTPPGIYRVELRAEAAYSSSHYVQRAATAEFTLPSSPRPLQAAPFVQPIPVAQPTPPAQPIPLTQSPKV